MFEVRIHGRGGQGVVTAAETLSVAAFLEGKHARASPNLDSERTGAPVVAFRRPSDREIRLREPIQRPDAPPVQDPTLLRMLNVAEGLKADGNLIINTARSFAGLREPRLEAVVARLPKGRAATAPATEKFVGRPAPNTAPLGAFAAHVGALTLESVLAAIRRAFPAAIGEANVEAAKAAHPRSAARAAV